MLYRWCSTDFDLSWDSVYDIHYLKDIEQMYTNCAILGDRGYLSIDYQRDLFYHNLIKLEVPMKKNQVDFKSQAYIFENQENVLKPYLLGLCDQFMIRRNYAKSFE